MPAGENKQDSREQVNRSLQIYLLYACSEKNTASMVWFQDRFSAKVNQHNIHWHKWKDLNSSSPGLYLLRSLTEAHAWWGTKPDPSAGYSCWRIPLDVSCIGLFFLFLLCSPFHRNKKSVFLHRLKVAEGLTPTPSKLAKTELLLSILSTSKSLQMTWRSLGEGMEQTEHSTAHLLAIYMYNWHLMQHKEVKLHLFLKQ